MATQMTNAEVHMPTSDSRMVLREKPGNQINNAQSNQELEHNQQCKEKCARKMTFIYIKCLTVTKSVYVRDWTEPKKVLGNVYQ